MSKNENEIFCVKPSKQTKLAFHIHNIKPKQSKKTEIKPCERYFECVTNRYIKPTKEQLKKNLENQLECQDRKFRDHTNRLDLALYKKSYLSVMRDACFALEGRENTAAPGRMRRLNDINRRHTSVQNATKKCFMTKYS